MLSISAWSKMAGAQGQVILVKIVLVSIRMPLDTQPHGFTLTLFSERMSQAEGVAYVDS